MDRMFTRPSDHPHLRQVHCPLLSVKEKHRLPRKLDERSPRLPYRRRRGEEKTLCHWGQKKLLLGEIEFLTECVASAVSPCSFSYSYTCIYAGASPGEHIPYLCYLFPQVYFVLFDTRPFCSGLSDSTFRPENALVRRELMSDEVAREMFELYGNSEQDGHRHSLLFISDIRSVDWRDISNHDDMDEEVMKDMANQQKWHNILKPAYSMLKFRLPWSEGSTRYLKGTLHLPVFGPLGTTESRLIVKSHDETLGEKLKRTQLNVDDDMTVEYDHKAYWEKMFFFNTITRPNAYENGTFGAIFSHDMCYDCSAESYILEKFIVKFWNEERQACEEQSRKGINNFVADLVIDIDYYLSSHNKAKKRKRSHDKCNDNSRSDCDNVKNKTSSGGNIIRFMNNDTTCSSNCGCCKGPYLDSVIQRLTDGISKCLLKYQNADSISWLALEEPEIDIPPFAVLDVGDVGVGYMIPSDSALDIWLWHSLRELLDARVEGIIPPEASTSSLAETMPRFVLTRHSVQHELTLSSLIIGPSSKEEIMSAFVSRFEPCSNVVNDAKEDGVPKHKTERVVLRLTSNGYSYLHSKREGSGFITRLNIPTYGNDASAFAYVICDLVIDEDDPMFMGLFVNTVVKGTVQNSSILCEALNAEEVVSFMHNHLDFSSEEWRQEILRASGIQFIDAKIK